MRILVVDDDSSASFLLERGLQQEGFVVDVVRDGDAVAGQVGGNDYDAILLDGLLGPRTGIEICRDLRARGIATPILVLSSQAAVEDRVAGLDSGADDYLVKPFAFAELLARIRALLRRGAGSRAPVLRVEDLSFDPASRLVLRGERRILLTAKEEAILELLLRRAGEVVTRSFLAERVWPGGRENLTNLMDVHMSKIRRKVDGPGDPPLIHTVRGRGYRVGAELEAPPCAPGRGRSEGGPI